MKTLGSRIAHFRKQKGLSQRKLATACGWPSQSRVGNYERGSREPSLDDLDRMANVLGLQLGDLLPSNRAALRIAEPQSAAYPVGGNLTARSREALSAIEQAAREGRLNQSDLILLESIAKRLELANGAEP